ncbi:hypothetical protein IW143_001577 [Coemansia sp. RSA 520]|nr:hypothetical protein LPJ54_005905 [Coemansia sp. RSA 1824]KAJ2151245.1 hypothetical protein J3F82_003467 [Coemansia sp. RSA 637]KAJ2222053.1 hypothetical protein IW143_001577 [Coemansia sp. RSA 520]KAJ2266576.1 hypothetical protein GGH14_006311 [Coemansia sp. RSA 370]KAJ2444308.1 hypothetical protein IWW46_002093 [Coemansia sp. RSA 2440]KAJ2643317.1 hypothetical protein IW137_002427 [Coemansia sp. RSA 1287]
MASVPSVFGTPQSNATEAKAGTCPPSRDCYFDFVKPDCHNSDLCTLNILPVIGCKWECGKPNLPVGCKPRCKPCHEEVCPAICECEIQCSIFGPCAAHIFGVDSKNENVEEISTHAS